ncbi:MAG: PepSY-associated TM helix domain-containing protein [Bacteroidia bacterium]|nr:PepSY-associated TM helix domain-containing protein [Bacteroidia bacterium]
MSRKKIVATFRKLHKWPGIIITIFAIHFAFSGIIMNHRSFFSGVDVSRKWLPRSYEYQNWNQAAVRGGIDMGQDSLLFFGNIGAWIKTKQGYIDYNQGFPQGIDNRKINQLIRFREKLIAATQFGLFQRNELTNEWQAVPTPMNGQRLVDLFVKRDTMIILSRNYMMKSADLIHFEIFTLPAPRGYTRSAGLFNTLWELHSGELFGTVGKLLVDLLGFVTILLSITGLLHFFFPKHIRRRKRITGNSGNLPATFRLNLRWHNIVGYVFVLFLVINTAAGIFLRPPLLIPIVHTRVSIIPGSHLDNNNPWHDKLRRGIWNERLGIYIFSTSEGFYAAGENLSGPMIQFDSQPPVSLMGCNVLKSVDSTKYLVGSFSGMYIWDAMNGEVSDFFTGKGYELPLGMSRPVSDHMVAGYIHDNKNGQLIFDYNNGIEAINNDKGWEMPDVVKAKSPISLWNLSLEIHTGRILEQFIGVFYLLYIPVAGICFLMVLISGFMVWLLKHRKGNSTIR